MKLETLLKKISQTQARLSLVIKYSPEYKIKKVRNLLERLYAQQAENGISIEFNCSDTGKGALRFRKGWMAKLTGKVQSMGLKDPFSLLIHNLNAIAILA